MHRWLSKIYCLDEFKLDIDIEEPEANFIKSATEVCSSLAFLRSSLLQ